MYIGDAVFVDGARPDVASANPAAPRSTRAGWGYLMLTNFLPNLGNGTLHTARARPRTPTAHTTLLGTKTITCTNSSRHRAVRRDRHAGAGGHGQRHRDELRLGAVARPRRADPPGGGTVQVVIDGAIVGAVPTGWTSRADLSALFPAAQYLGHRHGARRGHVRHDAARERRPHDRVGRDRQPGHRGGHREPVLHRVERIEWIEPHAHPVQPPPEATDARVARSSITGRRGFDLAAPTRSIDRARTA